MYRYIWKITLNEDIEEADFIEHWREGSTVLQEFPGARGTHMHRVRNDERSFFAVAEWESQAARDAMQAEIDAGETERGRLWQQFAKNNSFGSIIAFAGEEIDVVMPKKEESWDTNK